jgi:hypothetical protein
MNRLFAACPLCLLCCLFAALPAPAGDCLQGQSLPADFRAFAPDSPWNAPIPPNARAHPDSGLMIETLAAEAKRLKGDFEQWSVPLYVVDAARCPGAAVQAAKGKFPPDVDPRDLGVVGDVPIPDQARPDPQKDGHMLLVDPALRRAWDLSRAERLGPGLWRATRLAVWDLDGPGHLEPFAGKRWWLRGARGTGLPLLGGLLRPEAVADGRVDHALACALPTTRRGLVEDGPRQLCPPASRSDGKHTGRRYIPEGARLQLDPALDLDALGLSPATLVLARAMQRHGLYVADHGNTFKLYFQNLGPDRGAWARLGDFRDLARIPVRSFRVLDCALAEKD